MNFQRRLLKATQFMVKNENTDDDKTAPRTKHPGLGTEEVNPRRWKWRMQTLWRHMLGERRPGDRLQEGWSAEGILTHQATSTGACLAVKERAAWKQVLLPEAVSTSPPLCDAPKGARETAAASLSCLYGPTSS